MKVKRPSNIKVKTKTDEVTYSAQELYLSPGVYRTKDDHIAHATKSFVVVLDEDTAVFYDGIDTIEAFKPGEWTNRDRFVKIDGATVFFGIEELNT
jgi:hypothetical protein